MIITKEHQEALLKEYLKTSHSLDEEIGFIDGLNAALKLVKDLAMPVASDGFSAEKLKEAYTDGFSDTRYDFDSGNYL